MSHMNTIFFFLFVRSLTFSHVCYHSLKAELLATRKINTDRPSGGSADLNCLACIQISKNDNPGHCDDSVEQPNFEQKTGNYCVVVHNYNSGVECEKKNYENGNLDKAAKILLKNVLSVNQSESAKKLFLGDNYPYVKGNVGSYMYFFNPLNIPKTAKTTLDCKSFNTYQHEVLEEDDLKSSYTFCSELVINNEIRVVDIRV